MARILYLVHRIPFPPDKGDKVRSYHLLRHLAARHEVHLGTFIDDPEDRRHVATLESFGVRVRAQPLDPRWAKVTCLRGLADGDSLSAKFYRRASMQRWVTETIRRTQIDAAVVFSSTMAPYLEQHRKVPMLLDMVDADSAKWAEYALRHRWPLSWLYRREARCLLVRERQASRQARTTYLATPKEAELFRSLAPECAAKVRSMSNGVDTGYFAPDGARPSPFQADEIPVVFTGAMDYWPNVDAVSWFATEVLPKLRSRDSRVRFHVVGRAPTPAVRELARSPACGVSVTGAVPDVRPYLQHAHVVVAPLRLARGIQNKILEAMAMARPVVAARSCVEAMSVQSGIDIQAAETADQFFDEVANLLDSPSRAAQMGRAGRSRVASHYSWPAHLSQIDADLDAAYETSPAVPPAGVGLRGIQ